MYGTLFYIYVISSIMNSGLQPEIIRGNFSVTSYGETFIEVNKILIESSCIISTDESPITWDITNVSQLTSGKVGRLFQNRPDVVLIGTGKEQVMLNEELLKFKPKNDNNPLEFLNSSKSQLIFTADCMSTHAACRTFNFLAAEGRSVVAGLIID